MAAVEITITGMLYDKLNRTTQNVVLIGEASLTGLGVGGGPIMPPGQPPGGGDGKPPVIWGGPIDPYPGHPLPEPPPVITPPPAGIELPPPGSPPFVIPGTTPVHPIQPPPAIVVDYPGVGKVLVPLPVT